MEREITWTSTLWRVPRNTSVTYAFLCRVHGVIQILPAIELGVWKIAYVMSLKREQQTPMLHATYNNVEKLNINVISRSVDYIVCS